MPDPANAGDRAKAYRLRKVKKLPPVDALWLGEYDEKFQSKKSQTEHGASKRRSGRRVKLDIEEHEEAEAVGTGPAAAAAAAALAAREEGRRLDSLTVEAVGALQAACNVYKDICVSMKERMEILEETHIEMLMSVRDQYLARTQAEIDAMEANSAGGDAITKLAEQFLPTIMGKNGTPA